MVNAFLFIPIFLFFFALFIFVGTLAMFLPIKNIKKILSEDEKILKKSNSVLRFVPIDKNSHCTGDFYITNKRIIFIPRILAWKAPGGSILGFKYFSNIYYLKIKKIRQTYGIGDWGSRLNIITANNHFQFHFLAKNSSQEKTLNVWEQSIKKNLT